MTHLAALRRTAIRRRGVSVAAGALLLALSSPALANDRPDARRPGEIARDGVETLLRAFDEFAAALPRYALPEINDRGDIVIRRKNPPPPVPELRPSDEDSADI
ncbi:MAG TPA: hypothetical protein VGO34_16425 [Alphaproteobacteria bacterium]|jgi:hypothetical protein